MTRLEEITVKHQRIIELLERHNLNGVLLKKQANFSWFTAGGLNMVGIAADLGVTSLLITKDHRYVIANKIEAARMMDEEGLGELGFDLLEHEWYVDREAELIGKICGDLRLVGADVVYNLCPNLDGAIKQLRYCLTDSEIERYLFLGRNLSKTVEKVLLGVKPGDSECEVAGRVSVELWQNRIDPTGFMVAADERIALYRHPIPTQRLIKKCVMLSVNARYKGLITTVTRMLHFGNPDPALLRQYRDNVEIECRMIAATQPGTAAAVPFNVAVQAYRELGYGDEWKLHHQGGSMGYYARDMKATAETVEPVLERQAYCWNPSISGTKSEDGFIATSGGPVMITAPVIFPQIKYETEKWTIFKPDLMIAD